MRLINLQRTKENWLLFTFLLLFSLGILGFAFLDVDEVLQNSRSQNTQSLFLTLFLAIIVAPLLEELSFRGMFLAKKIFLVVSFVLISGFVLLNYQNYLVSAIFILLLVFYSLYKIFRFKSSFQIVCVLNALLFGFIHYELDDFTSIDRGFVILFQLSIGFLFIWITLNFGIIRSMVVHAIYNGIALSFVVASVQFPDTKINNYEDQNIRVEWQRVPYFESLNTAITSNAKEMHASHSSIKNVYIMNGINYENIVATETFMKYNFKIYLKENALNKDINSATAQFFLKEQLIISKEIPE